MFMFTPKIGEDEPNVDEHICSKGLVQPPTRKVATPTFRIIGIPNRYPLYKVYMGLIIKGTIPRVPPFSP